VKIYKNILFFIYLFLLSGCVSFFDGSNCSTKAKTLSSLEFKVNLTTYSSNKSSNKSIVIIPPTGGTNYIDRKYANQFCEAGFNTIIIDEWTNAVLPSDFDLDLHQRAYSRGQAAISLVLNEIKTPFVGILGTSLGALHASVAAVKQDKLNAVFLVVGGLPIMKVVVTSDHEAMQKLYKKRQEEYGFKNPEENLAALEKAFHLEPTLQGDGYKNKDIGFSIALNDTVVPTNTQQAVIDYFKPSTVLTYNSSHFWGIANTWLYSSDQIVEFFKNSSEKVLISQRE
jgi:hypothetical protein